MSPPSRTVTRRATLGLAAGAGLGALGLSPKRFGDGSSPDPATVWPDELGGATQRRFCPTDPGVSPGDVAWERDPVGAIRPVVVGPKLAYVVQSRSAERQRLLALDRTTGATQWEISPEATFAESVSLVDNFILSRLAVFADTVYVPVQVDTGPHLRQALYVLDATTGRRRWVHKQRERTESLWVFDDGESTYLPTDGAIRRYQPTTGFPRGELVAGDYLRLLAADRSALFVEHDRLSGEDSTVTCLRPDGSRRWSVPVPGATAGLEYPRGFLTPGSLILHHHQHDPDRTQLVALDRAEGGDSWRQTIDFGNVIPSLAASDTHCFLKGRGRLVCLDLATGDEVWDRTFADGDDFWGRMAVTPEYLYVGRADGLYRLDPATGDRRGEVLLPGHGITNVAIVANAVYATETPRDPSSNGRARLFKLAQS